MGSRRIRPIASFHVRPDHSHLYVWVRIYQSVGDLRRAVQREGISGWRSVYGCFLETRKINYRRREVGQILLSKTHIGVGTLTHEFTHATFRWARRRGLLGKLNDEPFCYALDSMLRKTVAHLYAVGLY